MTSPCVAMNLWPDLTDVLYASGGCWLYDTARLRLLGRLDSTYEPAYVEDWDVWIARGASRLAVGSRGGRTGRAPPPRQDIALLHLSAAGCHPRAQLFESFVARAVSSGRVFRRLGVQALAVSVFGQLTMRLAPSGTPGGRDCAPRPGRGAGVFRDLI